MPKRKGETELEWLARVRAARAYCDTSNDPGLDMFAFMALFHPNTPEAQVRDMVRDVREQQRRRR